MNRRIRIVEEELEDRTRSFLRNRRLLWERVDRPEGDGVAAVLRARTGISEPAATAVSTAVALLRDALPSARHDAAVADLVAAVGRFDEAIRRAAPG